MTTWSVEDHLEVDLDGVTQAKIKIIGGDVAVTSAPGPAHLEVRHISGDPVDVVFEDGVLKVSHPEWGKSSILRVFDDVADGVQINFSLKKLFGGMRGPEAAVTLTVPPDTLVDAGTVSAPLLVAGMDAGVELKTVSGAVTLKDLADMVDVKTVSGDVVARGLGGDLRAKTVSGDVAVVEGSCPFVSTKTVSGDVTLDLDLHPSGRYDIGSVSGDVGLRLPDNPNLEVELTSVSGDLRSDFDLDRDEGPGRKRIRGRVGDGGAKLTVKTLSGDLRLFRRRAVA